MKLAKKLDIIKGIFERITDEFRNLPPKEKKVKGLPRSKFQKESINKIRWHFLRICYWINTELCIKKKNKTKFGENLMVVLEEFSKKIGRNFWKNSTKRTLKTCQTFSYRSLSKHLPSEIPKGTICRDSKRI